MNKLALDKQDPVEFSCEKDALSEALGVAFRAAATKTSVGVMTGALIEAAGTTLSLSATNGDVTIRTTVGATVRHTGGVVLHRIFGEIVKSLPSGTLSVQVGTDGTVRVAAGRSKFTLRAYPRDQFPQLPSVTSAPSEIGADDLTRALGRVVIAASSDRARPILHGVLFEHNGTGTRLVATDSYRLALAELPGFQLDSEEAVLVGARGLNDVAKLFAPNADYPVAVAVDKRRVAFSTDITTVATNRIEGDFPSYKQLLPNSYPNELTVDRAHLLDALSRVSLLARALTPVQLDLTSGTVLLRAVDAELGGEGSEELDATYDGDAMTCAFNPLYLREGLEACATDVVTIQTSDPLKPVMLSGNDQDFRYLLMPVRL